MKKNNLLLALLSLLGLITSCYDDSELRERIEKLENTTAVVINQQITTLQSSIEALKSVDFDLKNQIAALEAADTSHQDEINALKKKDEELLRTIGELQDSIDSLRTWVEEILKNYSTTEEMNEQFAAVQKQIDQLKAQVALLLAAPDILFEVDGSVAYSPGTTIEVKYTLVNTDEETELECIADANWKASIIPSKDGKSGIISVTTPSEGGEGKVLVFVSTKLNTAMRVLRFEQGILTVLTNSITVEPQDTLLTIDARTNVNYRVVIPVEAQQWIELRSIDTRATTRTDVITFEIKSNVSNQSRSVVITIIDMNDNKLSSFTIFQRASLQANNEIWYTSTDGHIINPTDSRVFEGLKIVNNMYTEGKGVIVFNGELTTIGKGAFSGCKNMETISLPNSVTIISEEAFRGCNRLTSISLPNSVSMIGDFAFLECSSLTSISIPNSITSIPSGCFWSCENLSSVTIPESVTYIGIGAFEECYNLDAVYITNLVSWCQIIIDPSHEGDLWPSNPLQYAHKLFLNGDLIKDLSIPEGIKKVNAYAFSGCSSMTSVSIPGSVTIIDANAFQNCSSLTSVSIPGSVTIIGDNAFSGCSSLVSVTIPNSVSSFGDHAFSYCKGLTSVTIPNSVSSIGDYTFYECDSLTSITLPELITSIPQDCFAGCKNLTSVTIPEFVTSIGASAFRGCRSLISVTIPKSVSIIGSGAFDGCLGLTSVKCFRPIPPENQGFPDKVANYCTLFVPAGCIDAYSVADGWKDFKEIKEIDN